MTQLRENFTKKANILRADFEELQRQEQEVTMVSKFLRSEIDFWKRGYDSGV